jgi:integrase/recombinase XerD
MKSYKTKMIEDMKLRGLLPRTQEAYLGVAKLIVRHFGKEPDKISEEELRSYFLYLAEEKKSAPSTINQAVYGVRFLFQHTLNKKWPVLKLLRVKQPKKLPVVLSTGETKKLLNAIREPMRKMALTTIYALGIRLMEGLTLQTNHIDSDRLIVWIRGGKGNKDRAIPLPRPLLTALRTYWKEVRPAVADTKLIFVRRDGKGHINPTTLQKTIKPALADAGIDKHATIHSLRHSYATHLLEAGISLRTIQSILGHKSMRTTEVYMHVTQPSAEKLQLTVDRLVGNLC